MRKPPNNLRDFSSLLQVVETLRGPDGCPWDKEQTHSTLTRFAIEEAFELSEAIDSGNVGDIREELGDVLLQVVLHSEIARQSELFDISDVIKGLNEKMIRRHPHVFADVKAETADAVLRNWQQLKDQEKADAGKPKRVFNIPSALPALIRSQKIGEKTEKLGFDWTDAEACWPKIKEEIGELEAAMREGAGANRVVTSSDLDSVASELGDVIFSLVQLGRHLKLDVEQVVRQTNARFEARFERMQERVRAAGKEWSTLSADEKERFWKNAKI
jgi:tetrapyrrole methylase family protein/MazG family protein